MSTTMNKMFIGQLTRVRRRLATMGWTQGTNGSFDGPNCLQGAINYEVTTLNGQNLLADALLDTLELDGTWERRATDQPLELDGTWNDAPRISLVNWNDQVGTEEEIFSLIDRTIARLTN
jgi:hypothetical protein